MAIPLSQPSVPPREQWNAVEWDDEDRLSGLEKLALGGCAVAAASVAAVFLAGYVPLYGVNKIVQEGRRWYHGTLCGRSLEWIDEDFFPHYRVKP